MRVQLQYRCSLINYHSVLFCFHSKLRHFTPLHAHCFFLRTFQQFWDGGLVWAWLLYDDASGEARNRWSLPSPRWGFHACWTSKLCQETQYVASILSGTFVSCALGKWSFTPEVKFHLNFHCVTCPWWWTLTNGSNVHGVYHIVPIFLFCRRPDQTVGQGALFNWTPATPT